MAIDGRKLTILDRFSSYIQIETSLEKCKAAKLDPYSEEAAKKTKIIQATLDKAPLLKVVWTDFCNWVTNFNYKKDKWHSPIKVGFNIINYDNVILDRIAGPHGYNLGPWDEEYRTCTLFNPILQTDIMHLAFNWFEHLKEPSSLSMDSLREFFGMPDTEAHNAVFDVEQEADIFIRFTKLTRAVALKTKFKGACIKC